MNTFIGLKIKELRKKKNITQKQFSEQIMIDNSQLSKIEQGKIMPTLTQLLEISSKFKVSMDWLTNKNEIQKSDQPTIPSPQNEDKFTSLLKDKITLLEENKILQKEKIDYLEKEIKRKNNDIVALKEKIKEQHLQINLLKNQIPPIISTSLSSTRKK